MAKTSKTSTRPSRGASRRAGSAPRKRVLPLKALLLVIFAVALPVAAIESWDFFRDAIDRPVGRVMVEGDFRFVEREQVSGVVLTELTKQGKNGNFFALNLAQMQSHLQSDEWVDSAQIERRWPDTLVVRIKEHQPIARWSKQGFLSAHGELIHASAQEELSALPLLQGRSGAEQEVMQQYLTLSQLLRVREFTVTHLRLLATGVWQMQLEHGQQNINVALGRDEIVEKVQRMLLVLDAQLHQQHDRIESIDLRYSNGIAVRWRDQELQNIENS